MKYRAEIDGLRAIAVVPVILFHAGFENFSGGFVGVDVFFVISGYLITSIIFAEKALGTFSIIGFYERRARRILPALFAVMAICTTLAYILMLPTDLREYGQSLIAVSFFVSNIQLLRETGYFETAAELRPLLHTWSLAVEEQYYLLFPLLVILCWRAGRRWLLAIFVMLGAISFAVAQWVEVYKPGANFFLLQTRAWELLMGSLVALVLERRERNGAKPALGNAASGAGLLMICIAVFAFDRKTDFPGINALLPTLGTALIIVFATSGTFVGRLLGSQILVGVGLLSYSAYLWHQPLFAFARYNSVGQPSELLLGALSVVAIALAFLTWKYVETPFRNKSVIGRKVLFLLTGVGTLSFAAVGWAMHTTEGFEDSYVAGLSPRAEKLWTSQKVSLDADESTCRFSSAGVDVATLARFDECSQRFGRALVIAGNSHAGDVFEAVLINSANKFVFGLVNTQFLPQWTPENAPSNEFLEFIKSRSSQVERVLFVQAGFHLLLDSDGLPGTREMFARIGMPVYHPDVASLRRFIKYLEEVDGWTRVILIGPRVEPHLNMSKVTALALQCNLGRAELRENVAATFEGLDETLKRLVASSSIEYISAVDAIFFNPRLDVYDCDSVYWSDGDHWTDKGKSVFGQRLLGNIARKNTNNNHER